MTHTTLLSAGQMADAFGVSGFTLGALAKGRRIPYTYAKGNAMKFDLDSINEWLESNPPVDAAQSSYIAQLRENFEIRFPETIAALRALDREYREKKRGKGCSLVKVPSRKFGFLYYVRYIADGKLIASKWCAHTNDEAEARRFAVENKERIVRAYFEKKKAEMKAPADMYEALSKCYEEGSEFLRESEARGRTLGAKTRSVYRHFVNDAFIPYLRKKRIKTLSGVTAAALIDLQNHLLLEKGNKPTTVNRYFGAVGAVFYHFFMKGYVAENAFDKVKALKETGGAARGCHEIEAVRGAFNSEWGDRRSYMLCLMIYSTGMRNGEMARTRPADIVEKGGERFINIARSKTKSGERLVPLHGFVHEKLIEYIRENKIKPDEYIFSGKGYNQSAVYKEANRALGERLGVGAEELEREGISFYSGRHYWKTLMSAGGLGEDTEEYFMGHKVSAEVRKRYNHKDKRGAEKMAEKAREIFAILDKGLFGTA